MTFLKYAFWLIWKIWFYVLVTIIILLLTPILFVFTLREKWYPQFYWVARNLWAKPILYGMGFYTEISKNQFIEKRGSYILVANHTSVTDVMLMYVCSKNPFVFVGKKELARTPVFGYFYKRFAILVDRSSAESRKQVYASAKKRLNSGLSICIFPEGGVPDESVVLDKFKDGAFSLAIDFQIPIIPMTFFDNKRLYPFRFFAGSPGEMRVKIHSFVPTQGLTFNDKNSLKEKVRNIILQELEADAKSTQ
ncbi:1-acyl-sn-glycerol-3-phosphate acyltransferase [Capnocytophaga cynodegmi]|uniref:1-acyl-sn-glycerol-3-phosphate acyltransferase n=1 Tax=Capnocytophaga cynodegmi TaxID=28189 RepID=A0A250E6B9_9FLAO|nr:lysophospholipid acyltransferase family protein [Capnocytophaga cynodegmi]ATA68532.1 1-acyl-sn-glycerol-3-phosphate acyltransferase [Capnocytophaga cynodegmi]